MTTEPWAQQRSAEVRFDWGPAGVEAVTAPYVVIVDVLRFTTAVDAAVGRGARVIPSRWKDGDAGGASLSPVQLSRLGPGDQIVLPSPNGSTCAAIAAESGATVVAACLRNAGAVAAWLNEVTSEVAVIACGERWPDGSLRPALEDLLGAGAVIAGLHGMRSPEAAAAAAAAAASAAMGDRAAAVRSCASGLELVARGWDDDVAFACQEGVSTTVPVLVDGAFVDQAGT